jgi:hypothetical protein
MGAQVPWVMLEYIAIARCQCQFSYDLCIADGLRRVTLRILESARPLPTSISANLMNWPRSARLLITTKHIVADYFRSLFDLALHPRFQASRQASFQGRPQ